MRDVRLNNHSSTTYDIDIEVSGLHFDSYPIEMGVLVKSRKISKAYCQRLIHSQISAFAVFSRLKTENGQSMVS